MSGRVAGLALLAWDAIMLGANLAFVFAYALRGQAWAYLFAAFALYWIWACDKDWHRLRALHRASP